MNSRLAQRRELTSAFPLPKSICSCSHNGDGPLSAHEDNLEHGHGACRICDCQRFIWSEWSPAFEDALNAIPLDA